MPTHGPDVSIDVAMSGVSPANEPWSTECETNQPKNRKLENG